MTPDRQRLDSWKEIAQYLGRDVRTVIRWERDRGLPVSRVPGSKRSGVFAYRDELDQWLTKSDDVTEPVEPVEPLAPPAAAAPPPRTPAPRRWPAPLLALALAASVVALASFPKAGAGTVPARLALTDTDLQAFGARDALLWSRRLTATRIEPTSTRWSVVDDVDDDLEVDVLAAVEAPPPSAGAAASEGTAADATLWRLTSHGDVRWTYTADDELRFRDETFTSPWALSDLAVYESGGHRRIAWAVHHFTLWPSILMSIDPDGRRLGTFVNAGWIRRVEPTPDRRHLLVSGVSNAHRSYFLAVLDAARPFGRSPEEPGSATECLSCEAGDPIAYFVFPRSDVSTTERFPAGGPSITTFANGTVQVHVHESGGPTIGTTIYDLTPGLQVPAARFGDSHWDVHDQLHRSGALTHPAANCPDRAGRPVKVWTRATGWHTVIVPVR